MTDSFDPWQRQNRPHRKILHLTGHTTAAEMLLANLVARVSPKSGQTGPKCLTGFCEFAEVLANRISLPLQAESGAA